MSAISNRFPVTPALEILTEHTMSALYAFFCMDDMFPLSTYLRYEHLFKRTPLIPCVSYFMGDFKKNENIQRKGLDFIKYFAENAMQMASIAMHSPNAILNAFSLLRDVQEVQFSFCKIVSMVAKTDEFARENFIRFEIHKPLVEMLLNTGISQETIKFACTALFDLAQNEMITLTICENSGCIDAILSIMEANSTNMAIQIFTLRCLVRMERCIPDIVVSSCKSKATAAQTLTKTRKFLLNAMKENTLSAEFDQGEVEQLVNAPLVSGSEKCSIS
jgi:hypothetical protein